ncbi:MAG: hypothetical protein ACOY0T_28210 [Myxococcota bacterium]
MPKKPLSASGEARKAMRERLARFRARKNPDEQDIGQNGAPSPFHDVLLIGPKGAQADSELFRVPVVKRAPARKPQAPGRTVGAAAPDDVKNPAASPTEPPSGGQLEPPGNPDEVPGNYVDKPEKLDLFDYAERRTMAIARPQDWGARVDRTRGPAFGTLPVKREPAATHCFACYLVDAQNLSFRNAWTAEEWNEIGADDLEPHPSADDEKLELLLAGPRGKVFYVKLDLERAGQDLWPCGRGTLLENGSGYIESLNLRFEVEIWNQLRNGVVAGRVMSQRKAALDGKLPEDVDYVPLVNVTSLIPDDPVAEVQMQAVRAAERSAK